MRFRKTAVSLAAIGALAVSAPAALAGENERIDGKYGYVTFEHHGEVIEAADIYKDGYGVRAYLKWDGGSEYVTNPGKLYPVPKNLKIDENTEVYLRMCYTQNLKPFNCSDWQRAVA
jgi:hypothetical protein